MRQGKVAAAVLAAMSFILAAICAILYMRMDRTAPEIEFYATGTVYGEGMKRSLLLEGIRAHDDRDGDVTDRVVIEKVTEDRENHAAVVYYAVSDRSGNVAKASRVFDAVYVEGEQGGGRFPEAGISAEMGLSWETSQMDTGEVSEESPEELSEETGEQPPTPEPTPEPTETPTPAAPALTPEPAPQPTLEPAPRPAPTADPAVPTLTLKVSEVRVKAGQGPAWVDIISILSDDKDSYETLFSNLSVSKYDKNKAGTYGVSVYTEDSDGNRSQSVPLTIIVE